MSAPHDTPTLPPRSVGGTRPEPAPQVPAPRRAHLNTRISGTPMGLIAGIAILTVVVTSVIQNADAVNISFLGAHLRVSLAVVLLLAAIAGALIVTAAGTARITQLRRVMRRDRRNAHTA